jgi:hypothetical protein
MKRRWTRARVAWLIGGLAVLVGGYIVLKWLGLDANAIAAVASAAAALAAFGSASQSSAAARDAIRALSWSAKPVMNVDGSIPPVSEHHLAYIQNDSIYPVDSATVRWTLRDGRTGESTFGKLHGRRTPRGNIYVAGDMGVHYDPIDLGEFSPTSGHDKFEIEYRGANGPTTWRTVILLSYAAQTNPDGTVSYSIGKERLSDDEIH